MGALLTYFAAVLPSRGEGWGRPFAEAMAMQLPVIGACFGPVATDNDVRAATNWSGPTHFINETNAFPLRYKVRVAALPRFG